MYVPALLVRIGTCKSGKQKKIVQLSLHRHQFFVLYANIEKISELFYQ